MFEKNDDYIQHGRSMAAPEPWQGHHLWFEAAYAATVGVQTKPVDENHCHVPHCDYYCYCSP